MMKAKSIISLFADPLDLRGTKKVLKVNPTAPTVKPEPKTSYIQVYEYDAETITHIETHNIEDTFNYINSPKKVWINIDGLKKVEIEKFATVYNIHPLIIEDILNSGQRPKIDELQNEIFTLVDILYYNDKAATVTTEQFSVLLRNNLLISFQEDVLRDPFNLIRDRLQTDNSKVRQNGSDFLLYLLLDNIVDNYFKVMEGMADKIELMEEAFSRQTGKNITNSRLVIKLNNLRKEMILLKRSISPVRELLNTILKTESDLIEERNEKYFKDVYDHAMLANDLSENYRDMINNLQTLYINNINIRTNEVMKVMAIVTCLLAPATVIGGIFGMNFDKIPMMHNPVGFYISVALMLLIPVVMLYIFRKRGWF